ncbi:type I restriction endonuclease subunit R [Flavobacterium ginsenosidimutans]|uniref:type I restriction endonuclease subunit R n=1 Tax=Flavobacterium ginsenosidimutans TaxID=687844 RepID=UPI000DAC14F0|nr:DEAD/DEAH box helicase family protein [Flavobacterium ginsenosidimutans]KAF2335384.1 type I restriction endonuclease subunit R [Flavobacterium ginsenosidimutans]
MAQGIREIHLEDDIIKYLVEFGGFHEVPQHTYDRELCLIPSEIIAFLKDTQQDKYNILKVNQYYENVDEKIVDNIAKTYRDHKDKTLNLLRSKVKDRGVQFDMVYFQPANNKSSEHKKWYEQNRLAVIRQLKYSKKNENSIDLVLFVNGIPVVTLELKNELTGQNHHNAIKQYIQDREPKGEPLLEFKRCLVHFALGTQKIFMTTELKGKDTFFLPFNKGLENINENGFATSYLWEDVLTKDSLLDLIQNYINVQTDTEKEYDPITKGLKEKKSSKLLFPRFHQRRAVQRLLNALQLEGAGKNYLIQHSAGSGKSNTITWLAYRLAGFYQNVNDPKALFDSVIVVNDRRALDKQIQNNIRQLDNTPGLVAYVDENKTAQDLKKAIEDGKRIIITTIQKFPVISETIASIPDRKYAVLIDEAHSSQSGETARHLKKSLSLEEAETLDIVQDLDDIIADEIKRKGKQPNISFFAFTATPKPKTEELFGRIIDGKLKAFDYYTMEQAIKEGFIRDVLKNYMSFKRYYKIIKRLDIEDKEYDKRKTVRLLASYVDLQDHAIERKARIIIEHFVSKTQNEIQGRARAMVVTKSRLHAVRFKRKFDEIMQEMKLPYNALVAFSGTVRDNEVNEEYTESSMNQLQGKISIPEALKLPKYRLLIVADKYQTGFDEPMLHTMFVDKKLGGASSVQTLSRLNRTMRGKESTMVLDFVNDPESIQKDFQHFYGENFMEEYNQTDPNSLYSIQTKIDSLNVFYQNEIESFANIFFRKENNYEKLNPILATVTKRFQEVLDEDEQSQFKSDTQTFLKLYRFLSQIITFTDVELEKYYVFLTSLIKMLPYIKSNLPLDVLGEVELDSYKIQHQYTTDLELISKNGEMYGMMPGTINGKEEDELDMLTNIIKVLNDTFGIDLTEEDKVEFKKMQDKIYSNEQLMSFFNKNNSRDNIQDKFSEEIDNELLNFINTKLELYNKLSEDRVNLMFKKMWFNDLYDSKVRGI